MKKLRILNLTSAIITAILAFYNFTIHEEYWSLWLTVCSILNFILFLIPDIYEE